MKNKRNAGITLIALVITIIVLLILAGIAISMLTGDNSILQKAGDAKELTGIAEVEEQLKMEYASQIENKYLNGETETLAKAIAEVNKKIASKGWKIEGPMNVGSTASLSSTDIILGTAADTKTATIKIESEETEGKYYAKIDGKYYEIDNATLKIATTATEVSEDDTSAGTGDAPSIKTLDTSIATATISGDGKEITVTAVKEGGPIDLVVTVDGKDISAKITVLSGLKVEKLDGAMVLGKTTTAGDDALDNTGMTMDSKYNDIVTITNDGIVKCNQKEGDAIITVNGTTYKVTSTAKVVYTQTGASAPISGTASYDNPTIPTGFSAIDTKEAKWNKNDRPSTKDLNNGLVIMDGNGNQFVWIPVQYAEATDTVRGMARTTGQKYENGKDKYRGVLYDWTKTNYPEMSYKATSGKREPSTLSDCDGKAYTKSGSSITTVELGTEDSKSYLSIITDILENTKKYGTKFANKYTNENTFGTTMQEEYDKMIESVKIYGGFYVARYESSLIKGKTRYVSGSYSMNANMELTSYMWYGIYARQMAYAVDNEVDTAVTSSMIWGSQYDAMLNWMVSTGTDVTTKADNRKDIDGTSRNKSRITGKITDGSRTYNDKLNNIYDILGNSNEWSLEADNKVGRVVRGGYYNGSNPPSHGGGREPSNTSAYGSSRATLYIN